MKVYDLYDDEGQWKTTTANKKAIQRKIIALRGQSATGGGGKVFTFHEREVADGGVKQTPHGEKIINIYSPEPQEKPASGCKTFRVNPVNDMVEEVDADE